MSTAISSAEINKALKERLCHYAGVHNENLSIATGKLLLTALTAVEEAGIFAEGIDSQHTEESVVEALTPREIRILRRLLKKKK